MRTKGFSLPKKKVARFYRVSEGGIYQIVTISAAVGGRYPRVWVSCIVPEMYGTDAEPLVEADSLSVPCGGQLGEAGLNSQFYDGRLEPESEAVVFLKALPEFLEKYAFPFFDSVRTREQLWESMEALTRENYSAKGMEAAIRKG
jgi:hypothetical protein